MTAFPHYPTRPTHQLDGTWDFGWIGDSVDLGAIDTAAITYEDRMAVPGCFDATPAWLGRRGTALYYLSETDTPPPAGLTLGGHMG